jgi:hypothetical protein
MSRRRTGGVSSVGENGGRGNTGTVFKRPEYKRQPHCLLTIIGVTGVSRQQSGVISIPIRMG